MFCGLYQITDLLIWGTFEGAFPISTTKCFFGSFVPIPICFNNNPNNTLHFKRKVLAVFQPSIFRWYCWWKKSCTTWDIQTSANDGVFTILLYHLVQDFFLSNVVFKGVLFNWVPGYRDSHVWNKQFRHHSLSFQRYPDSPPKPNKGLTFNITLPETSSPLKIDVSFSGPAYF